VKTDRHRERALEFLERAELFRLGRLPTEQPHPATGELSRWARDDLPRAIAVLKRVDLEALAVLSRAAWAVDRLALAVRRTLEGGHRVYLCGCGATGRRSLAVEYLWRAQHHGNDDVVSFMAGGDVALVHSLEGFEDVPEYGARHLEQLEFRNGDLLISSTEGGETPYVIGATERAARLSDNRPFFLYCNDSTTLGREVERFRRIRRNPRVRKMCLPVGPMALAGSTRMQASTVLQFAVGQALLHPDEHASDAIARYIDRVTRTDFTPLVDFVVGESEIYRDRHRIAYEAGDYGITVFTDTTERAPTFSLAPFDHSRSPDPPRSLCYVYLDDTRDPAEAWTRLLNRSPRPLDWPEADTRTTVEYLQGFDFSPAALERRSSRTPGSIHHRFSIRPSRAGIELRLGGRVLDLPVAGHPALQRHLLLKQMLNIHSTLVMGRLGRYEGNLMTWVSPSNGKLVDRATRYVRHLLACAGCNGRSYEEVVHRLFRETDRLRPGESVVVRTFRSLMAEGTGANGGRVASQSSSAASASKASAPPASETQRPRASNRCG
jgi:N-acetylmuramic acid 6-phosphate etherase